MERRQRRVTRSSREFSNAAGYKYVSGSRRCYPGFGRGSAPGRWQPARPTSFFFFDGVVWPLHAGPLRFVCLFVSSRAPVVCGGRRLTKDGTYATRRL